MKQLSLFSPPAARPAQRQPQPLAQVPAHEPPARPQPALQPAPDRCERSQRPPQPALQRIAPDLRGVLYRFKAARQTMASAGQ